MDIAQLRDWLRVATLANVVSIDDRADKEIYDKIPLRGSVIMTPSGMPAISLDTPSLCEALIYSPGHGLLLVRSLTSSHGGKRRKVSYFAEFYRGAKGVHVQQIAYRLQGDKKFRIGPSEMANSYQSVIIGFAADMPRSNHTNPQPSLSIPWPA